MIHPDCEKDSTAKKCLEDILERQILKIIKKPLAKGKIKEDTISATIRIDIDPFGYVIEQRSFASINNKNIKKAHSKAFRKIILNLPNFQLIDAKPYNYYVYHTFKYSYLNNNVSSIKNLTRIEIDKNKYTGGVMEEAPLFPGCKRTNEIANRACFNQMTQKHIANNFRYPVEAQKKGISGRVNIMFTIDKKGNYTNIKSRGPHELLIQEAERIISLLPQFEPGMLNGKATKIPFSIPINFKLQ